MESNVTGSGFHITWGKGYKAQTSVSGAELFSHFCTFNYFGIFKIQDMLIYCMVPFSFRHHN